MPQISLLIGSVSNMGTSVAYYSYICFLHRLFKHLYVLNSCCEPLCHHLSEDIIS